MIDSDWIVNIYFVLFSRDVLNCLPLTPRPPYASCLMSDLSLFFPFPPAPTCPAPSTSSPSSPCVPSKTLTYSKQSHCLSNDGISCRYPFFCDVDFSSLLLLSFCAAFFSIYTPAETIITPDSIQDSQEFRPFPIECPSPYLMPFSQLK